MLHDNIYEIHTVKPNSNGKVIKRPTARFVVQNGSIRHLEDNYGLLAHTLPEGPVGNMQHAIFQAMQRNPYIELRNRADYLEGKYHENLPEAQLPEPPPVNPEEKPSSVFSYHRAGMDKPHTIEAQGNRVTLDGNELSPEETQKVFQNIHTGAATLSYRKPVENPIQKMEKALDFLQKAEEQTPEQNLLELDPYIEGLYNQYALTSNPPEGICVAFNVNGLNELNETLGLEAGDAATKTIATSAIKANPIKVFRVGGEFIAECNSAQEALLFIRKVQKDLDEVPPFGGTFKLTAKFGIGNNKEEATEALDKATTLRDVHRTLNGLQPGQDPHFFHSLIEGASPASPIMEPNPLTHPGMTIA